MNEFSLFVLFTFIIAIFLVVDLGFLNKRAHRVTIKSAAYQTLFWIVMALMFAGLIFVFDGRDNAYSYISAYVTEKMLSVDNLFVILSIFTYFELEEKYHHRVLFWGIMGAIFLRALFVFSGSFIVSEMHWVLYVFGAILLYSGFKMMVAKENDKDMDFEHSRAMKFMKKHLPFTDSHHGGKFVVKEHGKHMFTVLFMVLVLVEVTDLIFAVDSIPAAFSITQNSFVIYTSNIFAIMGLRSLFFLLEGVLDKFKHLQKGISLVLVFIGAKMLVTLFHVHISSLASLAVIMSILTISIVASLVEPKKSRFAFLKKFVPGKGK